MQFNFSSIWVGEDLQHEIKVSWSCDVYTESAVNWSEASNFNVRLQSKGDYPIDKEVVDHLLSAGVLDDDLEELGVNMSQAPYVTIDDTDRTDYECAINELKDEIKALEARKQELECVA